MVGKQTFLSTKGTTIGEELNPILEKDRRY